MHETQYFIIINSFQHNFDFYDMGNQMISVLTLIICVLFLQPMLVWGCSGSSDTCCNSEGRCCGLGCCVSHADEKIGQLCESSSNLLAGMITNEQFYEFHMNICNNINPCCSVDRSSVNYLCGLCRDLSSVSTIFMQKIAKSYYVSDRCYADAITNRCIQIASDEGDNICESASLLNTNKTNTTIFMEDIVTYCDDYGRKSYSPIYDCCDFGTMPLCIVCQDVGIITLNLMNITNQTIRDTLIIEFSNNIQCSKPLYDVLSDSSDITTRIWVVLIVCILLGSSSFLF